METKKRMMIWAVLFVFGILLSNKNIVNAASALGEESTYAEISAYVINDTTGEKIPVSVEEIVPNSVALYSENQVLNKTYEATFMIPNDKLNAEIMPLTSGSKTDSDGYVTVTLTNTYTLSSAEDYLTFTKVSGTVKKSSSVAITNGVVVMGHGFNATKTEYPGGSTSFAYSTGFAKAKFSSGIDAGSNYTCTVRHSTGSWTFYIQNNIH